MTKQPTFKTEFTNAKGRKTTFHEYDCNNCDMIVSSSCDGKMIDLFTVEHYYEDGILYTELYSCRTHTLIATFETDYRQEG